MTSNWSATNIIVFGQEVPLVAVFIAVTAVVLVNILLIVLNSKKKKLISLDSEVWHSFKLIEMEGISHDVIRFRFALHSNEHTLGLPIGQHISLKFVDVDGKEWQRSYTPTTSNEEIGYVDFVIKIYYKNVHPKFPEGGKMSQHMASLRIGDSMLMKGPKGHLDYTGKGEFTITHKRNHKVAYKKKKLGLVAGGTGITPMLQIIHAIAKNPKDHTEVWLIFANQTEEDILLRKELDALPKDRFHLHYTVDRAPNDQWKHGVGFVNTEMCRKHLPPPAEDTMLFVCGPPPMIKFACEPAFKELGFVEEQWFSF